MNEKIQVGIIGGAGYTGGELLRILINHPLVNVSFVQSNSQAGKPVWATHTDLLGDTDLLFSSPADAEDDELDLDVLFLCSGHGASKTFMAEHEISDDVAVIDLSTDFRDESADFVYGLPELNRERIAEATRIANPGCFATAIQLALLPLAKAGLLTADVQVSAVTGSTGAGQALVPTTGFTWRTNNLSIYKPFTHQHLAEIRQSLTQLDPDFQPFYQLYPVPGQLHAGHHGQRLYALTLERSMKRKPSTETTTEHTPSPTSATRPSTSNRLWALTNVCCIMDVIDGQILITSIIDNLTKGASGQAVQNMNLLFGMPEDVGLRLKSVAF